VYACVGCFIFSELPHRFFYAIVCATSIEYAHQERWRDWPKETAATSGEFNFHQNGANSDRALALEDGGTALELDRASSHPLERRVFCKQGALYEQPAANTANR
jgi:hypothetical protein